jgi:hypothetical protein
VGTQNLLMRKLGLLSTADVVVDDLECYMKLFAEGLTEHQVLMIQDLFMDYVPAPKPNEAVVEEEA